MHPRAVADTNVWVSAAIAPQEPIASPLLIDEFSDVLARRKFRRWLTAEDARRFVVTVSMIARLQPDPPGVIVTTADPDDDYLVALAQAVDGVVALVSGDPHLTELVDLQPPVMTPAAFLATLDK